MGWWVSISGDGLGAGGARGRHARRGFTLLEFVVAMGLTSVVVGAMVSAIIVVAKAGADNKPDAGWRRAAAGIERLQLELPYATGFSQLGAHGVTFTVADRTGDTAPETIRYAWSGVAGEGLIRTINGASETMAAEMGDFELEYLVRTETETTPGPDVQSSERLLASQAAGLLGLGDRTFRVEQDRYIAQKISPALPSNATSWSITRGKVVARADELLLGSGTAYVQVRPMNGTRPGNRVLAQDTISEGLLGLVYAAQSVNFGEVGGFAPTESAAIVVAYRSGDLEVSYTRESNGRFETQDAGSSWESYPGETLIMEVYGRYTTPGAPVTTTRYFLTGVRVRARALETAGDAVTTIALVDQPELTADEAAGLP